MTYTMEVRAERREVVAVEWRRAISDQTLGARHSLGRDALDFESTRYREQILAASATVTGFSRGARGAAGLAISHLVDHPLETQGEGVARAAGEESATPTLNNRDGEVLAA